MSQKSATSKADTAVKLVLIFFISLLSFSVGTYVGKQVSDSDHRRAALEAEYDSGSVAMTEEHDPAADEATKPISDEEVASLTEEFMKAERKTASAEEMPETAPEPSASNDEGYTHVSKMNAEKAEHVQEAANAAKTPTEKAVLHKAGVPATDAAQRVARDQAPAPDVKKKREPSAALPSVATSAIGKYTVQVASYATEDEAKNHAQKLKDQGYSAFFVPADIKGRTWYRVSIGLFSDQKSATSYRSELLGSQVVSSAIVQKITQ